MILNALIVITLAVFFVVPTVIQYREGETRRESIALASAQFGVLLIIAGIVFGIAYALATLSPSWL